MLIQYTKKLADTMKIKLQAATPEQRQPFYDWHANLFMFDRRKGVILMNNQTRYCILLYGLKAEHFKKFDSILLSAMEETFLAEGFSVEKVKKYIEHCGQVTYTKTHDKSILGQMIDSLYFVNLAIEDYIPSDNLNLVKLNKRVGKHMCGASVDFAYPIELLQNEMDNL